jgi:hypothetical protein
LFNHAKAEAPPIGFVERVLTPPGIPSPTDPAFRFDSTELALLPLRAVFSLVAAGVLTLRLPSSKNRDWLEAGEGLDAWLLENVLMVDLVGFRTLMP